jgi:hypothetical protein
VNKTHLWAALLSLLLTSTAAALPLYTAKAGRTCDNCHSLPNTWNDPTNVTERKCTLSCVSCHVDPNGGGLRNVSGRYYAENTLPLFRSPHRPLQDRSRQLLNMWSGDSADAPSSEPSSEPTSGPTRAVATTQVDPRGPGAPPALRGPAWGKPLLHGSSKMAWLDGRYDDMAADALLQVGGDFRLGFWAQGPLVFPMQGDVYAAVHPVEHLTLSATAGARGRRRSLTFDGGTLDTQDRFGVRDLWVMTHEWPALAYARVGRFMPAFGTKVADHTAYIRRGFGMDQADPANRVIGAEVGFNANYPYVTASAFKPSSEAARDPFKTGEGWGAALSAGWRDLAWSLGGSAMVRKRTDFNVAGDTLDLSVQWSLNPWRWVHNLPLTWLGEVTYGTLQRQGSGLETSQLATYQQLAWSAWPGITPRLRYDFWDPDREVGEDEIHRPGVGLDFVFLSWLSLNLDARAAWVGGGEPGADLFAQLHGWF